MQRKNSILNRILVNRKKRKRIFNCGKPYLKKGIYILDETSIKRLSIKNLKLHNLIYCYAKFKKAGKQEIELPLTSSINYSQGCAKFLFLFEDYVLGFYKDSHYYEKAKTNYRNNIDLFSYPAVDIIAFNDNEESIIMKRVKGVQHKDKEHDNFIISRLFEYAVSSPINKDAENVLYLQHGDVTRDNIIWLDDSNIIFIDLDAISFRPLLYDIVRFCLSVNMEITDITRTFNDNISYIKSIFDKFNLELNENYIDDIFYDYACFYLRIGGFYEDIAFLTNGDLSAYPKTAKLLSKL